MSFDLVACKICKSRYATEPMLRRIESALPVNMQKDSEGLEWIRVCPVCRRNIEAERATKQMVLGRSRKSPQREGKCREKLGGLRLGENSFQALDAAGFLIFFK